MAHICEYFPCHDWENGMTCENCYCPIYKKDCKPLGGNPTIIQTKNEIIKDCSNCLFPHKQEFKNVLRSFLVQLAKSIIILCSFWNTIF
jgi:Zn-finger protein